MWHQIKSGYEKAQTCCWNPSAGWVLCPSGAQENLKKAIWAYLSELELGTGKVPRPGSEGRLAGSLCLCTAGCPRAVTAHPVALFSSLFPFSLHLHLLSQRKCKSPSWVRVPLFLSFYKCLLSPPARSWAGAAWPSADLWELTCDVPGSHFQTSTIFPGMSSGLRWVPPRALCLPPKHQPSVNFFHFWSLCADKPLPTDSSALLLIFKLSLNQSWIRMGLDALHN